MWHIHLKFRNSSVYNGKENRLKKIDFSQYKHKSQQQNSQRKVFEIPISSL